MRFRFTLRDLLLFSILIGVVIGWWIDHTRLTRDTRQIVRIYKLKNADSQDALKMGQAMFADEPNIRVALDGGRIVLVSPDSDHTKFRAALRAIERQPVTSSLPSANRTPPGPGQLIGTIPDRSAAEASTGSAKSRATGSD